jgi:hypothetical protein
LGKTIKSPRNSWHSWRIPGGFLEELALVQKKSKTQNHPGIPGGFLEELTLVQKYYKIQNYPRIVQELLSLEIVVYGHRNRYIF